MHKQTLRTKDGVKQMGKAKKKLFPVHMVTLKQKKKIFTLKGVFHKLSFFFSDIKIRLHADERPNSKEKAVFVEIPTRVWTRPTFCLRFKVGALPWKLPSCNQTTHGWMIIATIMGLNCITGVSGVEGGIRVTYTSPPLSIYQLRSVRSRHAGGENDQIGAIRFFRFD